MKSYESTETYNVDSQPGRPYTRATREAMKLEHEKYRAIGLVLASSIGAEGTAANFRFWCKLSECVRSPNGARYYRKIDFLERWAKRLLVEEAKRFFPNGDMSRLVSLIGTEEGATEFARWECHKDALLNVAIDRCEARTGKRYVRADEEIID